MFKRTLYYFFFLLCFISCNNESKVSVNEIDSEDLKKILIVEIDYLSNKDDSFRMIFNKTLYNNQLIDLTITKHISASNKPQKVKFEMPIEGRPTSISLGLGNEEEKTLTIKKIRLKFEENIFIINHNEINKYTTFNKYVSFDAVTNTLTTKKINGLHSPVITFKPIVKKQTYR